MKAISIWQPFASLAVHGFKSIETRGYAAPPSVIGTRIAIAATKSITPAQRAFFEDEEFARFYAETGLPPLDELPRACVLGSAILHSTEPMTQELVEDLSGMEYAFGVYAEGRHAWRLRGQQAFGPYAVVGKQGFYNWQAPNELATITQDNVRSYQEGPPRLGPRLSPALGTEGRFGAA